MYPEGTIVVCRVAYKDVRDGTIGRVWQCFDKAAYVEWKHTEQFTTIPYDCISPITWKDIPKQEQKSTIILQSRITPTTFETNTGHYNSYDPEFVVNFVGSFPMQKVADPNSTTILKEGVIKLTGSFPKEFTIQPSFLLTISE